MLQHEFICNSCSKAISKNLTIAEYMLPNLLLRHTLSSLPHSGSTTMNVVFSGPVVSCFMAFRSQLTSLRLTSGTMLCPHMLPSHCNRQRVGALVNSCKREEGISMVKT